MGPKPPNLSLANSLGEATLLGLFLPEQVGLSYAEHNWSASKRAEMLVSIATGEAKGVKPGDQLAAIAYLDKLAQDTLHAAGYFRKDTFRAETQDGDVKFTHDIEVMKMVE